MYLNLKLKLKIDLAGMDFMNYKCLAPISLNLKVSSDNGTYSIAPCIRGDDMFTLISNSLAAFRSSNFSIDSSFVSLSITEKCYHFSEKISGIIKLHGA